MAEEDKEEIKRLQDALKTAREVLDKQRADAEAQKQGYETRIASLRNAKEASDRNASEAYRQLENSQAQLASTQDELQNANATIIELQGTSELDRETIAQRDQQILDQATQIAKQKEELDSQAIGLSEQGRLLNEQGAEIASLRKTNGLRNINDGIGGDEREALEDIASAYGIDLKDENGTPLLDTEKAYTIRGVDSKALVAAAEKFDKSANGTDEEKTAARAELETAVRKAVGGATASVKVKDDALQQTQTAIAALKTKDGVQNDAEQAKALGEALASLGVIDPEKQGRNAAAISDGKKELAFASTKGTTKLEKALAQATADGVISDKEREQLGQIYDRDVLQPGVRNVQQGQLANAGPSK